MSRQLIETVGSYWFLGFCMADASKELLVYLYIGPLVAQQNILRVGEDDSVEPPRGHLCQCL